MKRFPNAALINFLVLRDLHPIGNQHHVNECLVELPGIAPPVCFTMHGTSHRGSYHFIKVDFPSPSCDWEGYLHNSQSFCVNAKNSSLMHDSSSAVSAEKRMCRSLGTLQHFNSRGIRKAGSTMSSPSRMYGYRISLSAGNGTNGTYSKG